MWSNRRTLGADVDSAGERSKHLRVAGVAWANCEEHGRRRLAKDGESEGLLIEALHPRQVVDAQRDFTECSDSRCLSHEGGVQRCQDYSRVAQCRPVALRSAHRGLIQRIQFSEDPGTLHTRQPAHGRADPVRCHGAECGSRHPRVIVRTAVRWHSTGQLCATLHGVSRRPAFPDGHAQGSHHPDHGCLELEAEVGKPTSHAAAG